MKGRCDQPLAFHVEATGTGWTFFIVQKRKTSLSIHLLLQSASTLCTVWFIFHTTVEHSTSNRRCLARWEVGGVQRVSCRSSSSSDMGKIQPAAEKNSPTPCSLFLSLSVFPSHKSEPNTVLTSSHFIFYTLRKKAVLQCLPICNQLSPFCYPTHLVRQASAPLGFSQSTTHQSLIFWTN